MRKVLLASTFLAFAAPAFAGSPTAAVNGAYGTTGNFAFSNTTTNSVTNGIAVNPVTSNASSGVSYSVGLGNTPATYAALPNGAVGPMLNKAITGNTGSSEASLHSTGSAFSMGVAGAADVAGGATFGQSAGVVGLAGASAGGTFAAHTDNTYMQTKGSGYLTADGTSGGSATSNAGIASVTQVNSANQTTTSWAAVPSTPSAPAFGFVTGTAGF